MALVTGRVAGMLAGLPLFPARLDTRLSLRQAGSLMTGPVAGVPAARQGLAAGEAAGEAFNVARNRLTKLK